MKIRYMLTILASVALVTACQFKSDSTPKQEQQEFVLPMTDFNMASIEGENVSALDIVKKNKLTIVDFWASWCGPCRAEIPNVVSIYRDFNDKGLEIIGVSLDQNENEWHKAVQEMQMTWPQLSDLQGWNNTAARLYGVNAIPFTFVADSTGNIVAVNLRGQQLREFVAEKLK